MKKILIIFISLICVSFSGTNSFQKELINREFKIDTIKIIDEKRKLEIFLTIPISKISNLDSFVRKEILSDKDEFESEINERIAGNDGVMSEIGSDYSCILESTFEDKRFISYNFTNSQYFGGAAHGMSRFKSYNYDLQKNKFVGFSEYFNLKTENDTLFLLNLLTKRIDRDGVEVNSLKRINFNLVKDSISFNFDNYEIASYAEGLIQVRIAKKEIETLISNNYR